MKRLLGTVLAAALLVVTSTDEAHAIRLGGRAAADKSATATLREINLESVLAGAEAADGWQESADKLPDRCLTAKVLTVSPCDDDLRCGWLGARAIAIRAEADGSKRARVDAANFMDRIAERLAAGGTCGLEEDELDRWRADRRSAAVDASRLHLAVLATFPLEGMAVLPAAEHQRVRALLQGEDTGGTSRDEDELVAARTMLRSSWRRREWLSRHPGIDGVRQVVARAWAPIGALPDGCGEEILDPGLLDDQWRGYMVREVVPRAMRCIQTTLPTLLSRRGLAVSDPQRAADLARRLESRAAADVGGRTFATDRQVIASLKELAQRLEPRRTDGIRSAAQAPETRRGEAAAREKAPLARPDRAAAPSAAGEASKGFSGRVVETPAGPTTRALIQLASRASEVLGPAGDEYVGRARKATSTAERARLLEALLVAVHRELCQPFENLDPGDLEAAREALESGGVRTGEMACHRTQGEAALSTLLDDAQALTRLRLAAALRGAARLTALGRTVEARRGLDMLPESLHSTSWAIVYAWAARKEGDHVAASRALARADGSLVDRLRSSGDEEIARLVAQAWLSPTQDP